MHTLSNQSGFNPNLCFGDILFGFSWIGNPNVIVGGSKSPSPARNISTSGDQGGLEIHLSETMSMKSASSMSDTTAVWGSTSAMVIPRAHNFVRTHFHRATQCDFCGKKIWLKDAMQCQECSMCCHKKCIAKCQNATVCGPVDCSGSVPASMPAVAPSVVTKPEFTITQADNLEVLDDRSSSVIDDTAVEGAAGEQAQVQCATRMDLHRSSLTGMLAQGIKRQASNLDIPGIVSSLTGSGGLQINSRSLPPSPQHTPSRKSSMVEDQNPFERVTQYLEALPSECTLLNFDQVMDITEPIIRHTQNEDLMNLAKTSSKQLYATSPSDERVVKINELLSKIRVALDTETDGFTMMNNAEKTTETSPWKSAPNIEKSSDDRVQALSIIMLYLCTGLQRAQDGVPP